MKVYFLLFFSILFLNEELIAQPKIPDYKVVESIKNNNSKEFNRILNQIDSINRFIPEDTTGASYNNMTLLGYACAYKRVNIVKKLLLENADINLGLSDDFYIYDALYTIYQYQGKKKYKKNKVIAELLLDKGANPNSIYADNARSILHIASTEGDYNIVKLLLKKGANPDNAGDFGVEYKYYPLIAAVKSNKYKIVRLLIQAGANTKVKDENGLTSLDYALKSGNMKMIKLLKNKGRYYSGNK